MGSYGVPVYFLLTHILKNEIVKPKEISTRTLELGSKYSPDFVCTPFKYTLGTMIESLEDGADTRANIKRFRLSFSDDKFSKWW